MTDVLPPTTTTPAPQTTTPAPQRLEGEQLEEAIIKQIDYYFSRQNLANDAYLVSQMDSEMWVPVSIIAGFKKVHILTHDAEFILRVMSKSPNVVVDTQRQAIKPSWKLQRNTIILRECPSDATEEEIRQLFGGKFPITAVHGDVEATWFVTIDSEDNALDALMHLKNVTIRGQIVKARMKAEHLLKSSSVAQAYTQPYVMDPAYYHAYAAQYAQRVPYQQQQQYWDGQQDQNKERRPYRGGGGGGARRGQGAHGAQAAAPVAGQAQTGQQTHGGRPRGNSHGQGQAPFKGDGAQSTGGKGRGRKSKKTTEVKPAVINGTHIAPSVIVPLLNQQHFPSLPSPSGRPNKASFKSGYTADFRRFTKDDILKIITSVQDVSSRPANVIVAEPGVVEAKPNPTLEISKVPTLPEPEEEQEEQPETAAVAAPGVAVREWPSQKSPPPPSPSITSTPATAIPATTTTTAAAPSTQAPTPAASSTPISPPATKKEVPLRKSAEQGNNGDNKTADAKEAAAPNSPSINSSSDAIRKSTYADIALGVGRTNSPPIANAVKSPTLTATPSPSLNNAPPTSLEGKPQ